MKRYAALALTTVTLLNVMGNTATHADETLKWRHVQHNTFFQTQNINDVDGHSLSLYQLPGIAFFPDGSTGSTLVTGASDLTRGSGTLNGYLTVNFKDGSVLHMKYSGAIRAEGAKVPRSGTFTVLGGKGRYEGAKGDGTWEGDGTKIGPATISYIDGVVNITK